MFSNFFIKRPIFAIVVSLVIVISGLISMFQLPIEQYPNMAPVQIMVTASYPGADAKMCIRDSVESESKSVCLSAHSGLRGDIVESCLCKRRAVISNGCLLYTSRRV